ncbi:MAG: hypothetical protein NZ853_11240 [Leptospiraceae bacterium]|nr:hypothetical protein [Leptospiraceae bacterium]MDW7975469.1 hypothetical protein [Leptospiraceae bacterium]
MIEKCIKNAQTYGIPYEVAIENIQQRDSLENYPKLLNSTYPVYHNNKSSSNNTIS